MTQLHEDLQIGPIGGARSLEPSMCGRFTQDFSYADLHAYFEFFGQPLGNIEPRYNICPTHNITVVLPSPGGGHLLERMRWGLAPSWWKKTLKELPATFNARADTVAERPVFRSAFKSRRCVIPASGTFEWQDVGDGKQPWYFTPSNGPLFLIAGLWEDWSNPQAPSETVRSTTMIITEANEFVAQYHGRMPVLLKPEDLSDWLSGVRGHDLLKPAANDVLQAHPVSRAVNSSRATDEIGIIAEVEIQTDLIRR